MHWLIALIALTLLATFGLGVYLEFRPMRDGTRAARWWKGTLAGNLAIFSGASMVLLISGIDTALAQEAAATHGEISTGLGLAAFGAGLAVGPVGAASLAIISEKPEMFGRTLIYLGLAEGIAIYGLVVTILLLGKIA